MISLFMVEIQIQPKVERGKNDFFHFFRKEREEEQARLVGPEEGKGGALQRGRGTLSAQQILRNCPGLCASGLLRVALENRPGSRT